LSPLGGVEFSIELVRWVASKSKAQYRMITPELVELKMKLNKVTINNGYFLLKIDDFVGFNPIHKLLAYEL